MPKWGNINERRNQLHEVIRLSGMNLIIDDTDRLNFLQDNRVRICHIDDKFGVIKDGMVLGIGLTGDLREAIDGAQAPRAGFGQQFGLERRIDHVIDNRIGRDMAVLCEHTTKSGMCSGRTYADSPEIDGTVYFTGTAKPGDMVTVRISGCDDGDLAGEQIQE